MKKFSIVFICLFAVFCLLLEADHSKIGRQKTQDHFLPVLQDLEWRNIGPSANGGRVTDVEGVPGNPSIVYAGLACGGVWKTTNMMTWRPIFDKQPVASIGDIALEPGNPEVIYVGTGESNTRIDVSFGNGVYKSTDGGETWRHLGLEDTERISRIVINPHKPNFVYVGALGHAFGPNEQRGVFMSTDGGETWEKVLYVDDRHGVSDIDIDTQNPNILYAALWHFDRKPWTITSGSTEGGLFKSVDGGRTWKKLTHGLPSLLGRIGVKVSRSNPKVVYVATESKEGTMYRSDDGGETFRMVSKERIVVTRGFYYADLRIDPADENRVYAISTDFWVSIDGGRNWRRISMETPHDFHALWIDPTNPKRMWHGEDHGLGVSFDRGETWEYVNPFPMAQLYQIYVDNREPFYFAGGGSQDNHIWFGPHRSREPLGILPFEFHNVHFGDGGHVFVHPDDPNLFISENQGGNIQRTDFRTRENHYISPQPERIMPISDLKYRFNWNSPIILSPHAKERIYFAGNVVFKSEDFGSTWKAISPDLTTNDKSKQKLAGGPISIESSTAENHCTIISLAESPLKEGVIWAGTDDGNLQLTKDGGQTWTNLIKNVPRMPKFSPVSHIEPSRKAIEIAYCSFDRHMFDDFKSHIFKTEDYGATWKDISGNLPEKAYIWVIREDPKNPDLIYVGTELGPYVSFTAGNSWVKLHLKNLPAVSVHDLLIHPRENDIVIGTHGRAIWVLDDATPIQQLSKELMQKPAHLFDIRPALRFKMQSTHRGRGAKIYLAPNPPYGALFTYYFKEKPSKDDRIKLEVLDKTGKVIKELNDFPKEAGFNRTAWNLHYEGPHPRLRPSIGMYGGSRGPQALPGEYIIRLTLNEHVCEKKVEVRIDPLSKVTQADLKLQDEIALQMRDQISCVNDLHNALDSLKTQLLERKNTVRKLKPNTMTQEFFAKIDEHMSGFSLAGDRLNRQLSRRLNGLFSKINSVNKAPTKKQIEYFNRLKNVYEETFPELVKRILVASKETNELLLQYKLPVLIIPDPVQRPK